MTRKIVVSALIGLFAASAFGQSYWKGADSEAAIIIRYLGNATNSPYCVIQGTNLYLYEGSTANTVSLTNTASTVVATINAFTGLESTTNAYSRPWQAKKWATTGTEVLGPNKIVTVASNNFVVNQWETDLVLWDTSVVDHYDLVMSSMIDNSIVAPGGGNGKLTHLFGTLPGTGTCTVVIYGDATVKYQRAFPAVTGWYYGAATNVVPTTTEGDIPASGLTPNVYLDNGVVNWVRGSIDVSSGSTGGLGASVE